MNLLPSVHDRIGILKCCFAEGGKQENPEKTLEARERINKQLNSHEPLPAQR
jgi:hypothetical protein